MSDDLSTFAAFGSALADVSRRITLNYWRRPLDIHDKPDESPVTIADREAEAALRRMIEERYPDHGIAGEEFGRERLDADHVWSLDPIDGTKAFISGSPLFGTLIALVHRKRPVLGVIDVPAMGERWIGGAGLATTLNGAPVSVRRNRTLAEATSGSTSPAMFTAGDSARVARLHHALKLPIWGGDCYLYGMLALGGIDLVVECGLSDYDYLAPAAVVEGAGGIVTDWQGEPLGIGTTDRVLAAGDAALHAQALTLLNRTD